MENSTIQGEPTDDMSIMQRLAKGASVGSNLVNAYYNPDRNKYRVGHNSLYGQAQDAQAFGNGRGRRGINARNAPPGGSGSQQPKRDLKAEKLDYIANKYSGSSPNPDGDSMTIDNISRKGRNALYDMDAKNMKYTSEDEISNAIRKQLRKDGRTDRQIDAILANLAPAIRAKAQEGKDYALGEQMGVFESSLERGDMKNASKAYSRMARLDPVAAKMFGNSFLDNYYRQRQFDNDVKFVMDNTGMSEKEAKDYVFNNSFGSGNRSASAGRGSGGKATYGSSSNSQSNKSGVFNDAFGDDGFDVYTDKKYIAARKREEELESKVANGERLSHDEERELSGIKNGISRMLQSIYNNSDEDRRNKIENHIKRDLVRTNDPKGIIRDIDTYIKDPDTNQWAKEVVGRYGGTGSMAAHGGMNDKYLPEDKQREIASKQVQVDDPEGRGEFDSKESNDSTYRTGLIASLDQANELGIPLWDYFGASRLAQKAKEADEENKRKAL